MSKEKSVEDVREEFLDTLRNYAQYWANLPDKHHRSAVTDSHLAF